MTKEDPLRVPPPFCRHGPDRAVPDWKTREPEGRHTVTDAEEEEEEPQLEAGSEEEVRRGSEEILATGSAWEGSLEPQKPEAEEPDRGKGHSGPLPPNSPSSPLVPPFSGSRHVRQAVVRRGRVGVFSRGTRPPEDRPPAPISLGTHPKTRTPRPRHNPPLWFPSAPLPVPPLPQFAPCDYCRPLPFG